MYRSRRLKQVSAAIFNQVAAKKQELQKKGREMIDLSIGSPDLPPAPHILEQLQQEVAKPGNYGYTLQVSDEFRQAVAKWYNARFGVTLNPREEVLGLLGSQEGLANICLALLDPGDLVIVPDPAYPIYHAGPILAGAELYPLPLVPENNFVPQLDRIPAEVADRAKLMILNFPSNPAASTVTLDFFRSLVEFANKHSILVLHDAAYSELAYDGFRPPSFLQVEGAKEVGIEFNSLSKTFNMAGCRIGYAVGNPFMLKALAEIKGHTDYGPFNPIQKAAVAALTGPQDYVRATASRYQQRRDLLVRGLNSIGWKVSSPKATMFLWAQVPGGQDDVRFTFDLMERSGVCVVPGSGFGAHGKGYVRIALVQKEELLERAVELIAKSGLIS
ncbi:MAG: aminotransferase class I/II-fold pyridoxal phosphate-dependent enzyme [Firmicutes bacterium]|nr:aminotransferase class I/II-fold pyridoxal phosphate-dependent enzyme [Bacillota bacterium]